MSFQEISALGSVEAAREYVLEKEVEAILRSSHADQFKWMENAFKLPLNKGLDCWSTFIELTERRNLFVHTDGVVSSQYIAVCQRYGVKLDPNLKEGEQLWVSPSYFRKATACIYEIGIKLGHVLWRKLLPDEREVADRSFINLTYELLVNEEYAMAKLLLDFAFKNFTDFSNEVGKLSLLVNWAQAYKWSGDSAKCAEIMASVDWSARSELLRLASSVLAEQWDDSAKLMRKWDPLQRLGALTIETGHCLRSSGSSLNSEMRSKTYLAMHLSWIQALTLNLRVTVVELSEMTYLHSICVILTTRFRIRDCEMISWQGC